MFDIFKADEYVGTCWVETAATFQDAETRVRALARYWPADYVVRNRESGVSFTFQCSKSTGELSGEMEGLSPGTGWLN
ncbi:MAG: hypothetical protein ABSE45_10350 [Candidatus Acidiferrales bacterium]|jgi:hypothetical protein